MPVSIAPSKEVCQAIVDRINSALAYTLPTPAVYAYQKSEDLRDQGALQVDVIHIDEGDLEETLDVENPTEHELHVWVRRHLDSQDNDTIDALKLIVRQIWQRLNNYQTSRVYVRQCGIESVPGPQKDLLRTHGTFAQSITLMVRLEASP